MKNKKINIIITYFAITLIIIAGALYFVYNNFSRIEGISLIEKKWLNEHNNKYINISIYNNIPVYANNGSGIIFNYIDFVNEKYNINFSKVSNTTLQTSNDYDISFISKDSSYIENENDIYIYSDNYVILFKKSENISLQNIKKLGYLNCYENDIINYFDKNIELSPYDSIDKLITALSTDELEYIVIPNLEYMEYIIKNDLKIAKVIYDINRKYYLNVKDEVMRSILQKSFIDYNNSYYIKDYSTFYLDTYYRAKEINNISKETLNSKIYKYGYVVNMPYENSKNDIFVGTLSNYIKEYSNITGTEIVPIKYNSYEDLKVAILSGDIDFCLNNFLFDEENEKFTISNSLKTREYVILSKTKDNFNSIKGYKKIKTIKDSYYDIISTGKNKYKNSDELLLNVSDNDIVLVDKELYIYYQNNRLKDYYVVLEQNENDYNFVMNNNNELFNNIFNYYISSINYSKYRYEYNTKTSLNNDSNKYIIIVAITIIVIVIGVLFISKRSIINKVNSKDEFLKYIDPITGLKNRNYLNTNIYTWDDNVIFPQSVIVLDIDGLKKVNNQMGREAGDEIIKKLASILINNQLENTDIIRSGGDEFIIYMIGYTEEKVNSYIKKLNTELRKIPNSTGVSIGYSMIYDEIKTVDDAINEAINIVRQEKEKNNHE